MSENRKTRGAAALLILLAIASFATAAITITNITEWQIVPQAAPIVKVAGTDAETPYVNVTTRTESDGTNRTVISFTAYRGDITNYTDILKICNKDTSKSYMVELKYKGLLDGNWDYIDYISFSIGGNGILKITETKVTGSTYTTISPGRCASVSVETLVKANTPDNKLGQSVIRIEIDVVATRQ